MKTEDVDKLCAHLNYCFISSAGNMIDGLDSVTGGLFAIAKAIDRLAVAVRDGSEGAK